jgi:hypothetical protein
MTVGQRANQRDGVVVARRREMPMRRRVARAGPIAGLGAMCLAALAMAASPAKTHSPYAPSKSTGHAMQYYAASGGVGDLHVQRTASGNLIRFSYRVIDTAVAKALADPNATPYLFAPRSHALLQVPVMDKIGPLRQTGKLEAGRAYWVVFSNKGNLVKAGDRVNVIVGTYHIDGLMVE